MSENISKFTNSVCLHIFTPHKTVLCRFRCNLKLKYIGAMHHHSFLRGGEAPPMLNSVVWLVLHFPLSCLPIFCPTKASKTTQICRFILNIKSMITFQFAFLASLKGRVSPPKRMNFRKSSRGEGGVIFNPKIYIAKFGPLNRAFFQNENGIKGSF